MADAPETPKDKADPKAAPATDPRTASATAKPYRCELCGAAIPKPTREWSYRGRMPVEMVALIRKDYPAFHPKHDICAACGQKYSSAAEAKGVFKGRIKAWLTRRLG